MPFMETHEPRDTGPAGALAYISMSNPEAADDIANHPSMAGGITDEWTHAVALTYGESIYGSSAQRTLQEAGTHYHSRNISLPRSGDMSITVAKGSAEPPERTITGMHETLAWLEEYLRTPLKTANVLIHYGGSLPSLAKGANLQVSISQPRSHESPSQFHWLRHEAVHYWFNGSETWLDEGMAQLLTSLMEAGENPGIPSPRSPECSTGEKIEDVSGVNSGRQVASWCTYGLGERFLITILREAGNEEFRKGAASLAQIRNTRHFPPLRMKDVRDAFAHVPEALAAAESLWYHR